MGLWCVRGGGCGGGVRWGGGTGKGGGGSHVSLSHGRLLYIKRY